MALHRIRGEEVTAAGTALTMGNIAVAQGVTSGIWRLVEGIRAVKTGTSIVSGATKPLRAHPLALVATVAAEFLILKLLGEAESYVFHKMALSEAKTAAAALIARNNELIARMQRGERVDAAEFMQVQMALAHMQEEVANNRQVEARYDAADEIRALEERRGSLSVMDFLDVRSLANPSEKLAAMRNAREQYEAAIADIDRRIMHLRFRSEGPANAKGAHYKRLGVPSGGKVPYSDIPAEETRTTHAIPDRIVGGIYYDGVPAKTVKISPRQTALAGDLADTWTGFSNQLNDYVAAQNAQLLALAEQHAAVASR